MDKRQTLIWVYTCRGNVCSSYSLKTSKEAGYAADVAEKEKADKYQEFTHDFNFTPVANETLGSWGKIKHQIYPRCGIQDSRKDRREKVN